MFLKVYNVAAERMLWYGYRELRNTSFVNLQL